MKQFVATMPGDLPSNHQVVVRKVITRFTPGVVMVNGLEALPDLY